MPVDRADLAADVEINKCLTPLEFPGMTPLVIMAPLGINTATNATSTLRQPTEMSPIWLPKEGSRSSVVGKYMQTEKASPSPKPGIFTRVEF